MASKVKSICEEKVVPIIEEMGYDVVEVEYSKKSDGMNLIFYIDKDGDIQIDDCERVSKAIDGLLEELNPTEDSPYILSVSSPGLDRPLKNNRDFKRNLNKEISVTLFAKIDGKKKFDGILKAYNENEIILETNGKEQIIERNKIAHIVPVIKF